jgi:hypothetical protein
MPTPEVQNLAEPVFKPRADAARQILIVADKLAAELAQQEVNRETRSSPRKDLRVQYDLD